jgi:hypothetical protein
MFRQPPGDHLLSGFVGHQFPRRQQPLDLFTQLGVRGHVLAEHISHADMHDIEV